MEDKREIIETRNIKSKNGVDLVLTHYIDKSKYSYSEAIMSLENKKLNFYDSIEKKDGKWRRFCYDTDIKTTDDIVKYGKELYVFKNIRINCDSNYSIEPYNVETQKEMEELMKSIQTLLDVGKIVGYNDEHGVGKFYMKDKKIIAEHWRYQVCDKEETTIKEIESFIRRFFEIGFSLHDDWK